MERKLTRICVGNLIGLVWVQPHLLLSTAEDAGRQALLEPKHAGILVVREIRYIQQRGLGVYL